MADPRSFISFRISPSGDRVAFWDQFGRGGSIHVHDLVRGVTQQLNTGGFRNSWPTWSPDGMFIAFSSDRDGVPNLYRMAADGSGEPERLVPSEHSQFMSSWSSQGVIAYGQGGDIWVLPPGEEPTPFFTSEVFEEHASFSPDGRWLAYTVARATGYELYVRPFPGPGPATLISGNGSGSPAWSRDGSQLYFLQVDEFPRREVMMAVYIAAGKPSPARLLIDPWIYGTTSPVRSYDVLADGTFVSHMTDTSTSGERVAKREANQELLISELLVVINFFEELRQRVTD